MNYADTISKLYKNLSSYFECVFTNAEIIINDRGVKFPGVPEGEEWKNLSPSDQEQTIYIRRNGDDEVLRELKLSSCSKSYTMRTPLRIVFFKDHAEDHGKIVFNLMQSVLITNSELKAVKRDKLRLLKDESSGNYKFSGTTAYFGVDLYVIWELVSDNCEQDFCS